MSNRHERRKATAICRNGLARLKTATLHQHLDDMLGRVRAESGSSCKGCHMRGAAG